MELVWNIINSCIAGLALAVSGITAYYSIFRKCRITINVGDKIGLIKSSEMSPTRIQLNTCFINDSGKNGVIKKMKLMLLDPSKYQYEFEWNEFYVYAGNQGVKAESLPFPIPVEANSSINKGIQYLIKTYTRKLEGKNIVSNVVDWVEGKYEATIQAWMNDQSLSKGPNIETKVVFGLSKHDTGEMNNYSPSTDALLKYVNLQ